MNHSFCVTFPGLHSALMGCDVSLASETGAGVAAHEATGAPLQDDPKTTFPHCLGHRGGRSAVGGWRIR